MLIFFDTEFSDLGLDPKLISIRCVSEDDPNRTFYAELSDIDPRSCSDFVREAVLPLLTGGDAQMAWHELVLKLGNWIESLNFPVELATDSISWDWPWIQELFLEPGTWPANLATKPVSLPTRYVNFGKAVEAGYSSGLRRHHALDDAIANRKGYLAIQSLWGDSP